MSKAWDKIWEDLGVRVDTSLTDEEVLAACLAYREDTGMLPSRKHGDASKWFGFTSSWTMIDRRVKGLSRFLKKHGMRESFQDVSEEKILEACLAYREETGQFPTAQSGDASKWFGFKIRWGALNQRLGSLARLQIQNGLKEGIQNLSEESIIQACIEYHKEFGRYPTNQSGDASKWLGLNFRGIPRTWGGVETNLRSTKTQGLSKLLHAHGLREEYQEVSEEQILSACLRFYQEMGRLPLKTDGKSLKYTGVDITWSGINHRLRPRGLTNFLVSKGLKDGMYPGVSVEDALKACLAYKLEKGRFPTCESGDASKWFGFRMTWGVVNTRLGSLAKFLVEQKVKEKRALSEEDILKACLAYRNETGRLPSSDKGDASKWVGFPILWSGVSQRVKGLSKFLKKHGLKP